MVRKENSEGCLRLKQLLGIEKVVHFFTENQGWNNVGSGMNLWTSVLVKWRNINVIEFCKKWKCLKSDYCTQYSWK